MKAMTTRDRVRASHLRLIHFVSPCARLVYPFRPAQFCVPNVQVRAAQGLGDALVVNNIGAARDEMFIAKTVGRLGEMLRRNIQAIRMSGKTFFGMSNIGAVAPRIVLKDPR